MPKQRITKEIIMEAAFDLVREGGAENLLVKNIAKRIGCSVQPIYSYFTNIDCLKQDLALHTSLYFKQYIQLHLDPDHYFRSIGISYLHLAKQEPQLFRFYFMRKRERIHSFEDIYQSECDENTGMWIAEKYGIPLEEAKKFHMQMIIYTQGISSILIATGENIDMDEVMEYVDQAYDAFLNKFKK